MKNDEDTTNKEYNMSIKEPNMSTNDIEMIKLYFEEFKYRHDLYWRLFFKFTFAIIFLLVIPYIRPKDIFANSNIDKMFPFIGLLLCIVAAWILAAEYERIKVTVEKFNNLKSEKYKPIKFDLIGLKSVLNIKIGIIVTITFLVGFFLFSILDLLILFEVIWS